MSSVVDAAVGPPFSQQLRDRTAAAHRDAERAVFVGALLRGELTAGDLARMVEQQLLVYRALEAAAARCRPDPVAGDFLDPALDRVPALEADLAHLRGPGAVAVALPATRRYVERIEEVATTWPAGVVAHHYTRYMGDLSGGTVLGRVLERRYGVGIGTGASFYDFDAIGDADAYKARYRARLDAAPWSGEERERVIAESTRAFELNTAVFADLHAARSGA